MIRSAADSEAVGGVDSDKFPPPGTGRDETVTVNAPEAYPSNARADAPNGSTSYLFFYDGVYPDYLGGIEHRNYQLARALGARGHRVVLVGRAADATAPERGVTVHPIGSPHSLYARHGKRSKWQALRLAWHAARIDLGDVDIVESASVPLLHLFPLSYRCRRAGIPLIVTWHEYWGTYWQEYMPRGSLSLSLWRLSRSIERWAAKLGDRAIAVSRMTADRVESVRGEPIEIVANGIAAEDVRALGPRRGPTPGPLVYAGRLNEEKRIEILLKAAAILAKVIPGPILTIIGDGPMRDTLQQDIERLGLYGRVEMLGRLDTSTEVWTRMSRAKIAVHPGAREGFGLFALEAAALGLPVIYCASPESAVGEIIRHDKDGLEVPADPELLASAVSDLLDDPERYALMSVSAVDRAHGFDWNSAAEAMERLSGELRAGAQ